MLVFHSKTIFFLAFSSVFFFFYCSYLLGLIFFWALSTVSGTPQPLYGANKSQPVMYSTDTMVRFLSDCHRCSNRSRTMTECQLLLKHVSMYTIMYLWLLHSNHFLFCLFTHPPGRLLWPSSNMTSRTPVMHCYCQHAGRHHPPLPLSPSFPAAHNHGQVQTHSASYCSQRMMSASHLPCHQCSSVFQPTCFGLQEPFSDRWLPAAVRPFHISASVSQLSVSCSPTPNYPLAAQVLECMPSFSACWFEPGLHFDCCDLQQFQSQELGTMPLSGQHGWFLLF